MYIFVYFLNLEGREKNSEFFLLETIEWGN